MPLAPMPLAPALRQTLVDGLRRLYGERLRRVVLFGTEARGEATADSDVDLVVLADEVDTAAEAWRLSDLVLDVLLEFGRLIGFVVMTEQAYHHEDWPLLRNVRREGDTLLSLEEVPG